MRKKILIVDTDEYDITAFLGLTFDDIYSAKDFISSKEDYQTLYEDLKNKLDEEKSSVATYEDISLTELKEVEDQMKEVGMDSPEYLNLRQRKVEILENAPEITVKQEVIDLAKKKYDLYSDDDHQLLSGNDYMIVGKSAYDHIKEIYHLGVRNEYLGDLETLKWNRIQTNIRIKWFQRLPDMNDFIDFFDQSESSYVIQAKSIILKDEMVMLEWLEYFYKLDDLLGFDYETSGFPEDVSQITMGFSISDDSYSVYFDYTSVKDRATFDAAHKKVLDKNSRRMCVYNSMFEKGTTYRRIPYLYPFIDAAVINIIEERNWKRYSLKYTGQKVLEAESWDDDFDYLVDMLTSFTEGHIEEGEMRTNLSIRYPEHAEWIASEIIRTDDPYASIPAEILGVYCNKDAYNTLQIVKYAINKYGYDCVDHYNANLELGARLSLGGAYKDYKLWQDYLSRTNWYLAFSSFHQAYYFVKNKYLEFKDSVDVSSYNPLIQTLLDDGVLDADSYFWTMKNLVLKYINENYEFGLDENAFIEKYGPEIYSKVVEILKEYVDVVDHSISRKRSLFSDLEVYLEELIGEPLNSEEMNKAVTKRYYDITFESMTEALPQFFTAHDIKETVQFEGKTFKTWEVINRFLEIYPISSPASWDEYYEMFANDYFEVDLCLRLIDEHEEIRNFFETIDRETPEVDLRKIFQFISSSITENEKGEKVNALEENYTEVMESLITQKYWFDFVERSCFLPLDMKAYYPEFYEHSLNLTDYNILDDRYTTYCLVYTCMNLWKKFFKVRQYLEGMLESSDAFVTKPDKYHLNIPQIEGKDAVKMYGSFNPCQVSSKRWSAGFHTIPATLDLKRIFNAPEGHLMVYFDTSAAEVRAIAYKSGDPKMIALFESGADFYGSTAAVYMGKTIAEMKEDGSYKEWRSVFKVVVLSDFYNQSAASCAELTGGTIEDAIRIKEFIAREYPVAKAWCQQKVDYSKDNDGRLDTILGDKITLDVSYRLNNQGINVPIQNYTAVSMAKGFNRVIEMSDEKNYGMAPFMIVHDSFTCYFPVENLFSVYDFCYEHFSDYLFEGSGVRYEFDLKIGDNYFDMGKFTLIDETTCTLEGSKFALSKMYPKLKDIYDVDASELEGMEVKEISIDWFNELRGEPMFESDWSWAKLIIKKK